MIVVLDTSTLASGAVARPGSTLATIVDAMRARAFTVVLSQHILDELAGALADQYFTRRLSAADARAYQVMVNTRATIIPITAVVRGAATHPEDDQVLATAVSAQADYLVTGGPPAPAAGRLPGRQRPQPPRLPPAPQRLTPAIADAVAVLDPRRQACDNRGAGAQPGRAAWATHMSRRLPWLGASHLGQFMLLVATVACGSPEAAAPPTGDGPRLAAALDNHPHLSDTSVRVREEPNRDGTVQRVLRIMTHVDADTYGDSDRLTDLDQLAKREAKRLYGGIDRIDYVIVVFVNTRGLGPLTFTRSQAGPATPPSEIGSR